MKAHALALACFLLAGLPTAGAMAASGEPDVTRAFLASDLATRLRALLTEPLRAISLGPNDVMIAYYVPKQGALSEWDDETRFDEYHWDGGRSFRRRAFVTKAGQGLKGRMVGWLLHDLDGDGLPELVAVGAPTGLLNKVSAMAFRRARPLEPYKILWKRAEFGAALRVHGRLLDYTYQERTPPFRRRFERFALVNGELQPH